MTIIKTAVINMVGGKQVPVFPLSLLLAMMFVNTARAADSDEVAALRAEVAKLTQRIDQLSAKQETTDTRQAKLETEVKNVSVGPGATPQLRTAESARPVTSRYAGVDVRLFGSFDSYVESQQTGGGRVNRLASSGSGYTQLGFDASRDIGNGLRAFGDVRLSYQTDNGKTNSTSRTFNTATVGVTSQRWGTLQVGRMGTELGIALSNFKLIRLGTGNFIYNPATTLTHDNGVRYISPVMHNVQLMTTINFGETVDNQSTGQTFSGHLKYDDGKTLALASIFSSNAPTDISRTDDKVTIFTYGINHDFGLLKPFVVLQRGKSDLKPLIVDSVTWYAGVDIPVGPGTLRFEGESVTNRSWQDADARSANIRYDWGIADNTTVYFTYTHIFDEANVYYPIVGTGGFAAVDRVNATSSPSFNTTLNGKDPSSFAVGIKFDF
jgi:predicted porin